MEICVADYRLRRRKGHSGLAGAHKCLGGGCDRAVSANKLRCLDCTVKVATAELTARGISMSESEVEREMRKVIYG